VSRRVLDFLAGSLSGMLLGAVLLAAIVPTPLDWSKEAVPTSRPPEHADQPTGPGWMTTEDPLPSPDVAPGAGAPDRITPAPPSGSPPSTERGRGPESAVPPRTSMTLRGTASWYCLPGRSACTAGYPSGGLYAAAGPALRRGDWRGSFVTVELADGSAAVTVQLIDVCACPGGRVVDLYAGAFSRLAPLSAGVVRVRVYPADIVPPDTAKGE
jgi:hypothetical protein